MAMTVTQQHGQQLLDFSQKLDISLLDNVVGCLYNGEGQSVSCLSVMHFWRSANLLNRRQCRIKLRKLFQQRIAQNILTALKEHPESWTRVDTILEYSQNQQTKVTKERSWGAGTVSRFPAHVAWPYWRIYRQFPKIWEFFKAFGYKYFSLAIWRLCLLIHIHM